MASAAPILPGATVTVVDTRSIYAGYTGFVQRISGDRAAVLFEGGRHAVTRVRVAQRFGTPAVAARIECWLETGRTHQIRVHLAHTGHGLIGDPVYGGKRRIARKVMGEDASEAIGKFPRQALHASILGFTHPKSGEKLRFTAPLPDDFDALLFKLENTSA